MSEYDDYTSEYHRTLAAWREHWYHQIVHSGINSGMAMTPAERTLLRAVAHALLLRLEGRAETGVSELQAALAAVDAESPPPAPAPWTPSQGGIRSWPPW